MRCRGRRRWAARSVWTAGPPWGTPQAVAGLGPRRPRRAKSGGSGGAGRVARPRWGGPYVEGRGVGRGRAGEGGGMVERGGATFVGGGITGPPRVNPGTPRLYLSGKSAERMAALLTAGPLAAI